MGVGPSSRLYGPCCPTACLDWRGKLQRDKQYQRSLDEQRRCLRHEPRVWLDQFNQARATGDDAGCRRLRVAIYTQTQRVIDTSTYEARSKEGGRWEEHVIRPLAGFREPTTLHLIDVAGEQKLAAAANLAKGDHHHYVVQVDVVEMDCVQAAIDLQKRMCRKSDTSRSSSVALLNMANANRPGGGVENGVGAQEECLCRRSNLLAHLLQARVVASSAKGNSKTSNSYTIPEFGCLFTPNCVFFRDEERKGYAFYEQPALLHVISAAAYPLQSPAQWTKDVMEKTRQKIVSIFETAWSNQCEFLVLSALGCGEFRNPPEAVAKLFHEVLFSADYPFRMFFKHVRFAILGGGDNDAENDAGNRCKGINFETFHTQFID